MDLKPPVCNKCKLIGILSEKIKTHPWKCFNCGDYDLGSNLWQYTEELQQRISNRTTLFRNTKIIYSSMITEATIHRKFMMPNNPCEPNDRYRDWLEEHVGTQGVDWNWDIHSVNGNELLIFFRDKEHAILFELSCQ